MKVTKICCDICKREIPKQLCTEISVKYLISDKTETLDLCEDCRRKVINFMYSLGGAGERISYLVPNLNREQR